MVSEAGQVSAKGLLSVKGTLQKVLRLPSRKDWTLRSQDCLMEL